MSAWFLARGKTNDSAILDPVAVGDTRIFTLSAALKFPVGSLLFASDADGSNPEFLGPVTDASSLDVSFTLPARREREPGARVWRASSQLALDADHVIAVKRRVEPTIALERAIDGTHHAARLGPPLRRATLEITPPTPAREEQLAAWLTDQTDDGAEPFTLINADRRMTALRLTPEGFDRIERPGARLLLKLDLLLEAEDDYR